MDIIDPGHIYSLNILDDPGGYISDTLIFVKREGEGYPGNIGHHPGTTTQEVLRALIDRTKYVDNQIHDTHNKAVLYYLRVAILHLELRAAKRHGRELLLFDLDKIEIQPVCIKCNHIGCKGECH